MEAQLVACVKESLNAFLYDNAKFMCERLWAESNTEENMLLLATVYIRADQAYRAYHLLSGSQALSPSGLSMSGRYLLAQCCHKLGKFDEAKGALAADRKGEVPGGAAGCYLLGKLHSLTDNPSMAISCYQAALMQDPLLWSAYEGLCQLGHDEDASTILAQAEFALSDRHQAAPDDSAQDTTMQTPATSLSVDAPAFVPSPHAPRQWSFRSGGGGHEGCKDEAMMATDGPFLTPPAVTGPVQMPAPVRRGGQAGPRETPALTPMFRGGDSSSGAGFNSDRLKFLDEGKMRKVSNRLFADAHTSGRGSPFVTTRRGSRGGPAAFSTDDFGRDTAGAPLFTFKAGQGTRSGLGGATDLANGHSEPPRSDLLPHPPSSSRFDGPMDRMQPRGSEGEKSKEGLRSVLALIQQLGEGYGLLCRYQCQEAVAAFDRLDNSQYQTAWVMCQIGRACYEEVDFHQAAFAFQRAQQLDPCRLEGLEYFSTVLWHLKREVDLSHLAQEAIALDRLDPRAWCIMGNCFSLQKDHEAALKFFQRALQLEPSFTYAYTLAGHENLALEQFDKSLACYRNAMRLDPRHYNAWYGVGQIYYRQEKFEMAAYHFESSLKINSRSSVLRCYVGMVMAKLDRLGEAAGMLRQAIESDPNNPLARFELANVLVSTDDLTKARVELEILKDMAPREASVYFQLGKIERRLDNTERALLYYSTALDLKPSSADVNLIKSAIEKLRISNDSDEEEV